MAFNSNLWGNFPLIPGTQNLPATTAQNANPLPVMAMDSPGLAYYELNAGSVAPPNAQVKSFVPVGANSAPAVPYYSTLSVWANAPPSALLPKVIQPATASNYYASIY